MKSSSALFVSLCLYSITGSANNQQDHRAYAVLQECQAAAELPHNLDTHLSQYCVDSYLATQSD